MKKYMLFFIFSLFYSLLFAQQQGRILVPYKKGALIGLSDTLGNLVVSPQFDKIIDFEYYFDKSQTKTSSLFYVIKKGKKQIVDEANKLIPVNYSAYDSVWLTDVSKLYLNVRKDGKNGVLFKNKILIPCEYDEIDFFYYNSFKVKIGEKQGIINFAAKLIVPVIYDYISVSLEGNRVEYEAKYNYQNENKKNKIYYDTTSQSEIYNSKPATIAGISSMSMNERKKILPDLTMMKIAYDSFKIISSYDPFIYVYKNGLTGVYDAKKNLEIIKPDYEEVEYLISNRDYTSVIFLVKQNKEYGLFQNNKQLLKPAFDEIEMNLDLNSFRLKKKGLYGLLLLNTTHPYIKTLYETPLNWIKSIPVNEKWSFNIYTTDLGSENILVGENGVVFSEKQLK